LPGWRLFDVRTELAVTQFCNSLKKIQLVKILGEGKPHLLSGLVRAEE
jgi:hypothetical protein